MAIELYEHNAETYEKMTAMFEAGSRVGTVQPTGTGKSFIILKWIEDHPNEKFVVLSPSDTIFTQMKGYAKETGDEALLDVVQMLTYQKLNQMTSEEIQNCYASKIVVDEFHRTGAEQWGPALQKLLDANPHAKVLGTSATPVRYLDGQRDMAEELFDRNLAVERTLGEAVRLGILPTPIYVPVWYDVDGKMARYERDISQIKNKEERKELQKKLAKMKRRLENAYGADKIFKKKMPHDHGKFIVFCRDREHLEEMKKTVPKWMVGVNKNIRTYVSISAQEDKDVQLWAYVGDNGMDAIKLLFTIDRLNEGLHAKGTDGVIMLRPTESPIIYLQQMGRALAAGNKAPLIFDMVNNYQNVQVPLGNGETRNVFEFEFRDGIGSNMEIGDFQIFEEMMEFTSVFSALEDALYFSRNEIWQKNFALLERFIAEKHRIPKKREVYEGFKLGKWCERQKVHAKDPSFNPARRAKLKEIGLLEDVREANWAYNFALLERFIAEYRRLPEFREEYEGVKIGVWCASQSRALNRGTLPQERYEKLQEIGVFRGTHKGKWELRFCLLKQFVLEYGRFPRMQELYDGFEIGQWCTTQKSLHKNGRMEQKRYEKLQAINFFEMFPASASDVKWMAQFNLLKKFVSEKNRIPALAEEFMGQKIGRWLQRQRLEVKNPNFPAKRLEMLQSIRLPGTGAPMTLDGNVLQQERLEQQWQRNCGLYVTYKKEFGKEPAKKTVYEGINLGAWCSNQRTAFKNCTLSAERIKKLCDAGFPFVRKK